MKRYCLALLIISGLLISGCRSTQPPSSDTSSENASANLEQAMVVVETAPTASYLITFTAVMDDTVATSVHLTKYVAVTHRSQNLFWQLGGLSSEGLRQIAERGQQQTAIDELTLEIASGNANALIIADQAIWHPKNANPSSHPSHYQQTFTASKDHPYFSFASMIGPSPDWFVGVYDIPLFQDGQFIQSKEFILYAYDAGTKGTTEETLPHTQISVIEDPTISKIVYGVLRLEKQMEK